MNERQSKTKELFRLLETRKKKMGNYFKKHHPPYHHEAICANYLYMANELLNLYHTVAQGWANAVLKFNHAVVQWCANDIRT